MAVTLAVVNVEAIEPTLAVIVAEPGAEVVGGAVEYHAMFGEVWGNP